MAEYRTSAGRDTSVLAPSFSLRIHAEKRYRLCVSLPECLVGRAKDAHIRLSHPQVAPHHCRFYWKNQQLWVKALQGEVVLQHRPLDQALLGPGDLLQLGPVRLEILSLSTSWNPLPKAPLHAPSHRGEAPAPPPDWGMLFSQRLDHLEQLCRQLKWEEGELAGLCSRLQRLEEQWTSCSPQRLVAEALAPLQRRLDRLERRQRRLTRRLYRWWRQQDSWQHHLNQQLLHWDTQAQRLDQQLQQAQQSIDQARAEHQQLAQQLAQLPPADSPWDPQAVNQTVDQAVAPLLEQMEHLERRLRELEQWTRCLRRELRGEMHSEVESRLADLRAEREALETLRQNHGASAGAMPVTAPGVGFPVAKEKAPQEPAAEAEPPQTKTRQESPPAESLPAEPVPSGQEDSPAATSPAAEQELSREEAAAPATGKESSESVADDAPAENPSAESPDRERHAEFPCDPQHGSCLPQTEPEAHSLQPEESQPAASSPQQQAQEEVMAAGGCSLSTVELFRRLGIQVPGLEMGTEADQPPQGEPSTGESPSLLQQSSEPSPQDEQSPAAEKPAVAEGAARSASPSEEPPSAPAAFEGESVEDYMARLMRSIDSAAKPEAEEAETSFLETESEPPGETGGGPAEADGEIHVSPETLQAAPGGPPATLADSSQEGTARGTPAESPETLHTLRRLANTSARTAIETYQRRLKLTATQTKLLLSVVAMLASFAMMWFAGSLPHKWVYGAALGSLGISIYYGLRYLMLTAQATGEEKELLEERPA